MGFLDKFGRNYILYLELQLNGAQVIEPPFTIEFDITRTTLNSANVSSIRVYNLSQQVRNLIEHNIWNQGSLKLVHLLAGYGENLATIFRGYISHAYSVREGVNFITQIESYDGGYAYNNAQIPPGVQFPKGTPIQAVILSLITGLSIYGVAPGAIGKFTGVLKRDTTYSGNPIDVLSTLTNGSFFIDNGFANTLQPDEAVIGPIPLINSQSGLLGTPMREQTIISFDMLFEPRLQPGQLIALESSTGSLAINSNPFQSTNGIYKTNMIKHRGMISEAVCGDCVTTVNMTRNDKLSGIPSGGAV